MIGGPTSGLGNYSGLLDDFRLSASGLYNFITLPPINMPSFDIPNTKLLLHGNFSDLDFSGNRMALTKINEVSGSIEDYNMGRL